MSILSKLFGGGGGDAKRDAPGFPAEDYNGYSITPAPQPEDGGWRVGARIERQVGGEVKVHHLLRADVLRDEGEAAAVSLRKAKQVIDEQGERIFH
ncbi:HlyU family transcriptional regulator [Roseovarius ramblicola]|uniref:HlyU family transcriptional regulator n=1 Tax=Roseovarius ramblicola TaxID=2022336 RepID=A0ABV5I221_9RHOB